MHHIPRRRIQYHSFLFSNQVIAMMTAMRVNEIDGAYVLDATLRKQERKGLKEVISALQYSSVVSYSDCRHPNPMRTSSACVPTSPLTASRARILTSGPHASSHAPDFSSTRAGAT